MARELHKCLINYFTQLEKLDNKWKELCETAVRLLQALKNQCEQFRLVTSNEAKGVELCTVENLHEKLIFKILIGIENEVALLVDISTRFNNANQDLKNRLNNLEDARSKVSLSDEALREFIDGTPHRPKLNSLLEWAIDGYKYYHELYLGFNGCIKNLDYRNEETIENLSKSLVEDRFKRTKIDRILAFTQFLIKESAT